MREAILLVGGQGTRLRPLTLGTPKPMLPVAGVPVTVAPGANAPLTALKLAEFLAELFPAGVVNIVFGRGAACEREIVHRWIPSCIPHVEDYSFTCNY